MQQSFYASSDSPEWYTPDYILTGAIKVLGAIDCDPCSNPPPYNVPATVHYTQAEDGLIQPWHGRVYMNPPYGKALPAWVNKLATELALGRCTEAIALAPARTDTTWFRVLWGAQALCFVYKRVHFKGAGDFGAPFPTALAYWGPDPDRFGDVFAALGEIIRPRRVQPRAHQLTLLEGVA